MKMSLFASMVAVLLWVAAPNPSFAGSLLGNSDADTHDDIVDNCRDAANETQIDTDLDGCGNACDADYNNDGIVGGPDFFRLKACFGLSVTATSSLGPCASRDNTGDGIVGGPDFFVMKAQFGLKPGISLSPLRKPALCRAF